jgi:regulatory protein
MPMKQSQKNISKKEALLRLQNLCSRAEKSEFEIRTKLINWGLEKEASTIISQLEKDDFLNPVRFAHAFVNDKIKINKWGKIKVRYQLRRHHISDDVIENTLAEYDDETYLEMINSELKKKRKSIKDKNHFRIKAKLLAFGNQRGYEHSIITQFFDNE